MQEMDKHEHKGPQTNPFPPTFSNTDSKVAMLRRSEDENMISKGELKAS